MPNDHPGFAPMPSTPEVGSSSRAGARTQPMQHGHRPAASEQIPASLVPAVRLAFSPPVLQGRPGATGKAVRPTIVSEVSKTSVACSAQARPALPNKSSVSPCRDTRPTSGSSWPGRTFGRFTTSRWPSRPRAWGRRSTPTYSFYSITEISEYVPDADEYARILRERERLDPDSSMFKAKVAAYAERLGPMNRQRLYPDFPSWPCLCFYPMSKMRTGEQNWYMLPYETRSELMSQHGRSGMKFAGRVSQVITASTGLDDWEWGVTLWARNPSFLKDIVYTMRFDESSAKFALFGDFYFGYILPPDELLETIRL